MICEVCSAPAVILDGRCAFCRAPVAESHAPAELLDYLAARLPRRAARARRPGLVRRGGVSSIEVTAAQETFRARVRGGRLVLEPDLPPARWVDRLLGALSQAAAADPELRAALTRAGWAIRET